MKTVNILKLSPLFLVSMLAFSIANAGIDKVEKEKEKEKDDNRPPIGCRDKGYRFELEALHLMPGESSDIQSMYVVHNMLNQPVNLFQMRSDESSRSTFLNHVIGAHEWGVLSTNEKQVKFICTIPSKKSLYGQVVDCAQSFNVCEYTNVRYGLNNRGSFWLANSSTKNAAASAVVHYGIIPGN